MCQSMLTAICPGKTLDFWVIRKQNDLTDVVCLGCQGKGNLERKDDILGYSIIAMSPLE